MHFSESNHNKPNIIFFDCLDSTNDYAKALLKSNKPSDFTVIHTHFQTNGRGQRGNVWISGEGLNLTASWIHYPFELRLNDIFYLNMWVALSLHDALSDILPIHHLIKIKWPNDIYVDGKKIAGILIENTIEKDKISETVIGIGVNINGQDFTQLERATSLHSLTEKTFSIQSVLFKIHESLIKKTYLLKQKKIMRSFYLRHLFQLNEEKSYQTSQGMIIGKIVDCTESGLLVIVSENEIFNFDLKQVQYLL